MALRQTELVVALLRERTPDLPIKLKEIRTEGDKRPGESLARIGGQGVFVKELEAALLRGEIDFAVHSLKDMPADLAPGCDLAAMPERGDSRDALVSRGGAKLADLPAGARVGTGSARRAVQLRALRPDVVPVDIRGNVDTRVRKVDERQFDAAVLAVAGLERLGLLDRAAEVFAADVMLPAVGQGALAVEARADDTELLALLAGIDHRETRLACEAERSFLQRLGGGCRLPFGALAEIISSPPAPLPHRGRGETEEPALSLSKGRGEGGPLLRIRGFISDAEGARTFRAELAGPAADAISLGAQLAELLLAQGAAEFVEASG